MTTDATLAPNPRLNLVLLKLAHHSVDALLEKDAVIPGGDPSGGMGGGAGAPPPADPSGGMGGGAAMPPAGGGDQASQIAQMVMQQMGGAGGPGGKGKSPKDQIQQGQMKILMHLVAQMASKMGIQVDPQLLVPSTDPSTDQVAMQELQGSSMAPSADPNAPPQGGAAPPPQGPPGVPPMDPSQGPIGKAAAVGFGLGSEFPGRYVDESRPLPAMPELAAIVAGGRETRSLAARTRAALRIS